MKKTFLNSKIDIILMISINCFDLINRIEKKYSIESKNLVYFDYKYKKTLESFTIQPEELVELIERIENSGFEHIGEDFGNRIKNLKDSLKSFLKKETESVSFTSFSNVFFYKKESPSGIVILSHWGWIFVPGLTDPYDTIYIDYINQPKDRKERIKELCKKYKLKWFGSVTQPVLFRFCEPTKESFESFIKDVNNFFEETGYAEI